MGKLLGIKELCEFWQAIKGELNNKANAADVYTKTQSDDRYVNVTGDSMTGALTLTNGLNITGGSSQLTNPPYFLTLNQSFSDGGAVGWISSANVPAAIGVYTKTEADNRYVNVTGDTMTGNLAVQNTGPYLIASNTSVDVSKSNNNRSSTTWYGMPIRDSAGRTHGAFYGFAQADGIVGAGLWVYAHDTSGTQTASGAFQIKINKSGTVTYSVSNATNFRDALGASSGVWTTAMIPNLAASKITSGTLALARGGTASDNTARAINTVFAGPSSGSAGNASWRALVAADIPNISAAKITSGSLAVARGGTGRTVGFAWTQIMSGRTIAVNGTASIGSITSYNEIMIVCRPSTHYVALAVLPIQFFDTTAYEIYLTGGCNQTSASSINGRAAACTLTSAGAFKVIACMIDGVSTTGTWFIYAR